MNTNEKAVWTVILMSITSVLVVGVVVVAVLSLIGCDNVWNDGYYVTNDTRYDTCVSYSGPNHECEYGDSK